MTTDDERRHVKMLVDDYLKEAANYELFGDPLCHVYFQRALEWDAILHADDGVR